MDNPFENLDQKLDNLSLKVDALKGQVIEQIPRKEILTIEGVVGYTGLKPTTILKHKRNGELQGYKQGGRLYFRLDDVIEWLTKNKTERLPREEYKSRRKNEREGKRQEVRENLKKLGGYDT
jgi:hypothetical protein